jgi:hypothetical protein
MRRKRLRCACDSKLDCLVKSPNPVTPAKAGVQKLRHSKFLDRYSIFICFNRKSTPNNFLRNYVT